jgi:hypothetical protein
MQLFMKHQIRYIICTLLGLKWMLAFFFFFFFFFRFLETELITQKSMFCVLLLYLTAVNVTILVL